ncbi:MAG: nicotinate phosphoribosyltransferase, partial [Ferrovibrio sp.]
MTQLVPPAQAAELERQIAAHTDAYFKRTKAIVQRTGDKTVTYAVFMRRPVIFCPRIMIEWIEKVGAARGVKFQIELLHEEGTWVGAGEPLLYLTGPMSQIVDLDTLYLQT